MGLIIPKCNAEPKTIYLTLKIYYDANDWLENRTLIELLSNALLDAGVESEQKEPQSYTKKTQVLSYYGLLEWENSSEVQSRRRITQEGRRLFELIQKKDTSSVQNLLLDILSSKTFGRNVLGCNSDSDLEVPNIFLKCCLLMDGVTTKEFAYILGKMEFENSELTDAIIDVIIKRKSNSSIVLDSRTSKWADAKPILALENWGLITSSSQGNCKVYRLSQTDDRNFDKIRLLRTYNTEERTLADYKGDGENITKIKQTIFFGAPGSGKSHRVKELTKGKSVHRTTFHPDSDYASFEGCYKPTMSSLNFEELLERLAKEDTTAASLLNYRQNAPQLKDKVLGGEFLCNLSDISYTFTPQVFTEAYVEAWNNLDKTVYLVIEEINRGNCAQIFGDLFQLLDRDSNGYSVYPITADHDLRDYLSKELGKNHEGIKEGKLCLPPNLHILATMNTSDQSLFPMDSAFKRRWDWEYIPIDYSEDVASGGYHITLGDKQYRWVDFLKKVNELIRKATDSEDKQMGNFFIKGDVKETEFKSKVMFFLWNEVCRDEYHTQNNFFRISADTEFSFNDLYGAEGLDLLHGFMDHLGLKAINEESEEGSVEVTEGSKEG